MNLKTLPQNERPRERLMQQGAEVLSAAELIAVILGSGTKGKSVLSVSSELLSHFGSLSCLLDASIEDLCKIKGLGKVKAMQLKAALTLASRAYREKATLQTQLNTPLKVYLWVRDLIVHNKKEVFGTLLIDARGAVIRWEVISIGTLTNTLVHPREVFYPAIRHLAASVILVHNHPSGDPEPSPEDYHLTRQLITAGRSVMIPILDHLIIGANGYCSLKERGLKF